MSAPAAVKAGDARCRAEPIAVSPAEKKKLAESAAISAWMVRNKLSLESEMARIKRLQEMPWDAAFKEWYQDEVKDRAWEPAVKSIWVSRFSGSGDPSLQSVYEEKRKNLVLRFICPFPNFPVGTGSGGTGGPEYVASRDGYTPRGLALVHCTVGVAYAGEVGRWTASTSGIAHYRAYRRWMMNQFPEYVPQYEDDLGRESLGGGFYRSETEATKKDHTGSTWDGDLRWDPGCYEFCPPFMESRGFLNYCYTHGVSCNDDMLPPLDEDQGARAIRHHFHEPGDNEYSFWRRLMTATARPHDLWTTERLEAVCGDERRLASRGAKKASASAQAASSDGNDREEKTAWPNFAGAVDPKDPAKRGQDQSQEDSKRWRSGWTHDQGSTKSDGSWHGVDSQGHEGSEDSWEQTERPRWEEAEKFRSPIRMVLSDGTRKVPGASTPSDDSWEQPEGPKVDWSSLECDRWSESQPTRSENQDSNNDDDTASRAGSEKGDWQGTHGGCGPRPQPTAGTRGGEHWGRGRSTGRGSSDHGSRPSSAKSEPAYVSWGDLGQGLEKGAVHRESEVRLWLRLRSRRAPLHWPLAGPL